MRSKSFDVSTGLFSRGLLALGGNEPDHIHPHRRHSYTILPHRRPGNLIVLTVEPEFRICPVWEPTSSV